MRTIYDNFIGKYGVSKTLCFELIPQKETLKNMEKRELLLEDEHRAESYQKVKNMIDEFHKYFIDDALSDLRLEGLERYLSLYDTLNKNEQEKLEFEECQAFLRKQIVARFKAHPLFKKLFSKELIKDELVKFYENKKEDLIYLSEFSNFTTYFTGFHENRKNIYSEEAKSTAVSYRVVHQNLPRFIDNMRNFEKLKTTVVADSFEQMKKEYSMFIAHLSIDDMFTLESFHSVLTQEGISNYNLLIGGYSNEKGEKIKGLNEYINLYNQKVPKAERLGKMQPLYKQILSDRQSDSFIPKGLESDEEVLESLQRFYKTFAPVLGSRSGEQKSLMHLMMEIDQYDLDRIFIRNHEGLNEISQKLFGDWSLISRACKTWYDINYDGKKKFGTKAYEEEREKFFQRQDSFSIAFLNTCCLSLKETSGKRIEQYFARYCDGNGRNFSMRIEEDYQIMEAYLEQFDGTKKLGKYKAAVSAIKTFLDSVKEFQWFLKPLLGKGIESNKDEQFYGEFLPLYDVLNGITLLYNQVRNYLTRKPYSTEKIKLNFSNSSLLSGWSLSKESSSAAVILLKDGAYYLGIMDKSYTKVFEGSLPCEGEVYRKMDYKLLPGANKMLPKVFFSKGGLEKYHPSEEILRIYKNGTFKKGNGFSLEDCHKLIDFFKDSIQIHDEWSKFGFVFSDTETYADISGFYREVEAQGYQMLFRDVSCAYIDRLVEEGKLYLFQIYNKDFSPYSKGTPNLHTMYWKALFTPENLNDVVYKLNGQAEIFYRKASIVKEDIITHPANEPIANKNILNPKKESLFPYTLYKDKRYTMDKFQFHVPLTMNFKATGLGRLNEDVNRCIKNTKDVYVIGINRGERHLLYLSVLDPKGNIVEQYSLNEIVSEYQGMAHHVNYHDLLDAKERERDAARKNWDTIENIKELKEGYISQVIHKITQLMLKYHAIVVIEDLNIGFLRSRQAIEKAVYQKFVKMLIDKLNYYVDKKADPMENGGLYRAYQLTNRFESFQKLGKQSGFVFFAPSWYISNMDPTTGFVNLLYPKYENVASAKDFFGKFDRIFYDAGTDYFCFALDYSKFTDKADGTRTNWTLCSHGDRVLTYRNKEKNNQWDYKVVYPTELLKSLFARYGIVYDTQEKGSLQEQILAKDEKGFFVELYEALRMILQMRNFNKEADYFISPVLNDFGIFYDSREAKEGLPDNIEANAAYNIARKGLWMLEQIRNTEDKKLGKGVKLALTNQEWLKFAQGL